MDLAFSADGTQLAIACDDGRIVVVEMRPAGRVREFGVPRVFRSSWQAASAISFAPSGTTLALGYGSGAVRALDLGTGVLTDFVPHGQPIRRVAFSQGGRVFAADQDGALLVYDVGRPRLRPTRLALPKGLVDLEISPDRRQLAALLARGDVHLLDTSTLRQREVLRDTSTSAARVAISHDGGRLAVVASDGGDANTLWLWDLDVPREPLPVIRRHGDGRSAMLGSVAFSPSGQIVALSSSLRCVHLLDAASGRDLRRLVRTGAAGGDPVDVWDHCFTPEGHLLVGYSDGVAVLWDSTSGAEIARFGSASTDHSPAVVAASAGGLIALVSGHQHARIGTVYDRASGATVGTFAADAVEPGTCAFIRSGLVAVRREGRGDSLEVWSVAGERLDTLLGEPVPISSVAAIEGADCVIVGTWDGSVRLTERGVGTRDLRGHSSAVLGVALSSDGGTAASASHDGSARVWCAVSGRELLRIMHSTTDQWVLLAADGHAWWSSEAEPLLALVRSTEARTVPQEFKAARFRHRSVGDVRRAFGLTSG